jgi:hypothetical protein
MKKHISGESRVSTHGSIAADHHHSVTIFEEKVFGMNCIQREKDRPSIEFARPFKPQIPGAGQLLLYP